MSIQTLAHARIAVIGLGYVGLPLAVALACRFRVTGFDRNAERINELREGREHTGEVEASDLRASPVRFTDQAADIAGSDVFIVTVPTPVDSAKRPDLDALLTACLVVGGVLRKGAVVVFESTVYPGVTETICGPALAAASGLACGSDFFLGYSPERVNPGDKEHRIERIVKVVSGQTPEVAAMLAELYGAITTGGVFVARSIRTAEAAKVIENAQRDINIAFINEVSQILGKLGVSVFDVLETARTKWNFLDFQPGLVGGHCIGVDPYYLAHLAKSIGHEPEIILAGRRINDRMGDYVAERIAAELAAPVDGRVLVLGLTFKEDVPDLRNSKVVDVIEGLKARGHRVEVHDPIADRAEAKALYGIELVDDLDSCAGYDGLVAAVAHRAYRELSAATLDRLVRPGGLVADIKGIWRALDLPKGLRRWQL